MVEHMSNRFVFVVPMFNASKTLERMLYSVIGQSYENWRLILIDDASDHNEYCDCVKILTRFNHRSQIKVIYNEEKKWEVANVLNGISFCEPDDIVCRLDADDYLSDLDTLRILDTVYRDTGADCIWTAHRWFDDKQVTNFNISRPLPDDADPYKHPWVTSHLKTFRKSLLDGISDQNFRGADGQYIKRAGDQAIYLPALYRAKKRVFLPMCMYSYRCDMSPATFQTDDAKFQAAEAEFIRQRGFVQ
jgi:glycosyltransferase involved in cell wall biosynthesis